MERTVHPNAANEIADRQNSTKNEGDIDRDHGREAEPFAEQQL